MNLIEIIKNGELSNVETKKLLLEYRNVCVSISREGIHVARLAIIESRLEEELLRRLGK